MLTGNEYHPRKPFYRQKNEIKRKNIACYLISLILGTKIIKKKVAQ
jgi:hypothetical protein